MKLSLTIISIAASIVAVAAQNDTASVSGASTAAPAASTAVSAVNATTTTAASNATDATASTGSSGSSYQAPSGISSTCSTFLKTLDTAPAIQSCISPALDVLQGTSPSLDALCAKTAASSCSETAYYNVLSYFSGNCTNELVTSPNSDVGAIYDSLYVSLPFQKAVCTKDNLNKWCAQASSNATSSDSSAGTSNAAQSPLSTSQGYPNPDAFTSDNILFLGAHADQDASTLCTTCLQKVLTIYFGHEAKRIYPSGLNNSPLLAVQSDLWKSVQQKCPADFVSSAIGNAGAAPSQVNAAPAFTPAKSATVLLALVAGVFAL